MGRCCWHRSSDRSPASCCRNCGLGSGRGTCAEWARRRGRTEIDRSRQIEEQLRTSGNIYWTTQVEILTREVMAWSAQADKKLEEAAALLRASADEEDAIARGAETRVWR